MTTETTSQKSQGSSLVRELGTIDATMIVVGSMIGSGIFITSAESARLVGTPGWLLAAWAVAGLMTVSGAATAAEIAAMMPRAGGQYVFLRDAYSPMFGFLFGWAMFLVVQTGTIAAVSVAFAKFLGVFLPGIAADVYLVSPIRLGRIRRQPLDPAARGGRPDRGPHGGQHAGPQVRQMDPEHVHLHQDGGPLRADRRRDLAGHEPRKRRLDFVVVGCAGQRLVCRDGLPRPRRRGRDCPLALVRPGDDRAAFLAVGLEQRDVHRRRDPRARARACPAR